MITDFTFEEVKKYLPKKKVNSNKYDSGQLLLIGGDNEYPGAIILAAQMAIKSGIGLLYLYTKSQNVIKILNKYPEIIVFDDKTRLIELVSKEIPVLAGPGTKNNKWTEDTFNLIKNKPLSIILDAAYIEKIKLDNSFKTKILLPHEGEAARLLGVPSSEVKDNRVKSIKDINNKYGSIVILKGYRTLISDGRNVYRCLDGGSKLSTAGTGDVLAGLIASLISQGVDHMESCKLAVAIHGSSADSSNLSKSLIASELIEAIRIRID
tara:strand:+ start:1040 stop:1837 length:798 start_codon:yes stop_codon:yes gene_type:complete